MNRHVLCSWFLCQKWYRCLPAGKNPQYIGTHSVLLFSLSSDFKWAIISDILHYYSMAHTEGPLLQIRTSTYTGIRSFHHGTNTGCAVAAAVLSSISCFPPTHAIVPKFSPPIKCQDKHDRLSKSSKTLLHFNCSRKTYGCSYLLNCFSSASCRTLQDPGR